MSLLSRTLLGAITLFSCAAASAENPLDSSAEGRAAFDDLTSIYADPGKAVVLKPALQGARLDDPQESAKAGRYLLALLRQSAADEKSGRSVTPRTPFWGGGGGTSGAAALRKQIFEDVLRGKIGAGHQEIVRWFATSPLREYDLKQLADALPKCSSDVALPLYRALLQEPDLQRSIARAVLQDIGVRRAKELEPEVRHEAMGVRQSVREEARKTAAVLELGGIAEFKPVEALSVALEEVLRDISGMVWPPLPKAVALVRFEDYSRIPTLTTSTVDGFLLSEGKETDVVLSLFGARERVSHSSIRHPLSFSALAATFQSARETLRELDNQSDRSEERERAMNLLSRSGLLTAQFESDAVSAPELLVAAAAFSAGEREVAAELLFAALDRVDRPSELRAIATSLFGNAYHMAMVSAFQRRDYQTALDLANHLSKKVFDDFAYQRRAEKLARELPLRKDDFVALTLPTPEAWSEMRAKLTPDDAIRFLASRLRLLNLYQLSQPGALNYEDKQVVGYPNTLAVPREDLPPAYPKRARFVTATDETNPHAKAVINPFVELKSIAIGPKRILALLPFLEDDHFLPAVGYWRDFHPGRSVPEVRQLVSQLINLGAERELVPKNFFSLSDAERRDEEKKVRSWCKANATKSREELLVRTLRETASSEEFERYAERALQQKSVAGAKTIIVRAPSFPGQMEQLWELLFASQLKPVLPAARSMLRTSYHFPAKPKSETAGEWGARLGPGGARFWAAMTLYVMGDAADKENGLRELGRMLDAPDDSAPYALVQHLEYLADKLVENGSPTSKQMLCTLLERSPTYMSESELNIMKKQFLAGCPQALAKIRSRLLDETSRGIGSEMIGGVTYSGPSGPADSFESGFVRAPWRAEGAGYIWAPSGYFARQGPMLEKLERRKKLVAWLEEKDAELKRKGHLDLQVMPYSHANHMNWIAMP